MNIGGSEARIDIYDDRMKIYSLVGMSDGSMIQDREPIAVFSTRRKLNDITTLCDDIKKQMKS